MSKSRVLFEGVLLGKLGCLGEVRMWFVGIWRSRNVKYSDNHCLIICVDGNPSMPEATTANHEQRNIMQWTAGHFLIGFAVGS